VQTLDISQPFDAGQAFRKAINPPSKWKKPSAKTESADATQEDTLEEESSGREQQVRAAMKQAKEIRAEAKKRGVTFWLTGDTSVAAKKEFTKGDIDAFHKAYHDCTAVLSLVKLGSGENEWGCSSAGVGTGAQECVKSGVVTRNKSGMGGKILLQALDGKKFYDSRGMPIREEVEIQDDGEIATAEAFMPSDGAKRIAASIRMKQDNNLDLVTMRFTMANLDSNFDKLLQAVARGDEKSVKDLKWAFEGGIQNMKLSANNLERKFRALHL
jgi:hypothetical protein